MHRHVRIHSEYGSMSRLASATACMYCRAASYKEKTSSGSASSQTRCVARDATFLALVFSSVTDLAQDDSAAYRLFPHRAIAASLGLISL